MDQGFNPALQALTYRALTLRSEIRQQHGPQGLKPIIQDLQRRAKVLLHPSRSWTFKYGTDFLENYFNYFTDIEEHFCRRRGSGLLLSTLDWALMQTWKDAGIPLEAVLRGVDATFDHYERRPPRAKTKKINGLAWCAQEVLSAAEEMKEAAVGTAGQDEPRSLPGMGPADITKFLRHNSGLLAKAVEHNAEMVKPVLRESSTVLLDLALQLDSASKPPRLEDLERHLTVLEEKLLAALTVSTPETVLLGLRTEADREIAPYRSKMPGLQIEQLRKQFVHKRLFEQATIPRLSLFYM